MRKLIFCFLFFFESHAQKMIMNEFLGRPSDVSVSVKVFFDSDVELRASFGISKENLSQLTPVQNIKAGNPGLLVLENLNANSNYYYQVQFKKPFSNTWNLGTIGQFSTQKSPGTTFTFTVQADPHVDEMSDTLLYQLCLKNQLEDRPDFMIDLGDIVMIDKLKNKAGQIPFDTVVYRYKYLRSFYETLSHSVPIFVTLGNHEGEGGWNLNNTANNIAVWGTNERKKYFLNPQANSFYSGDDTSYPFVGKRESYYAWTWGDALFVVIDPFWFTTSKPDANNGWKWTLGKAQYDWLSNTLKASKSKFKFIFSHHLVGGDPNARGGIEFADLYEWGGKSLNGNSDFSQQRPGWDMPIKDLLKKYQVNIFFHGHDHFFGKQELECLVYQECPQPSLPNFQNANQVTEYGYLKGEFYPNAGHLRVQVSPDGVKVDYVRAYLPKNETPNRKNKDVSATYFIGKNNCYNQVINNPVLWNQAYEQEIAYPNPFKDIIRIKLFLDNPQHISIRIYNIQGQLIRTLIQDQPCQAGNFEVQWDGKNDENISLPPGTYLYQIQGTLVGLKHGKISLNL